MMYTILGSFCSFLNWEEANIRPQIRPRKISALGFELPTTALTNPAYLLINLTVLEWSLIELLSLAVWSSSTFFETGI